MINHARTLLLNRTAGYFEGLADNVYIPEEFVPAILDTTLSNIKDAIIPPSGSRQQELDVARIVLRILHSPDLLPYVTGLDSRITYTDTVTTPAQLASGHVQLIVSQVGSDIIPRYKFTTPAVIKPLAGVYKWSVASLDAERVTVVNTKGMSQVVTMNPTSRSSTSTYLEIIPGYLSIYFILPTLVFTGAFKIDYELTVSASYDVVQGFTNLNRSLALGPGVFNSEYNPDVMPVLKDIWLVNPSMVTRFGAGVLGYIYSLEGRR